MLRELYSKAKLHVSILYQEHSGIRTRLFSRMTSRTLHFLFIGFLLLVIGIGLVVFFPSNPAHLQTFPAIVNGDCAPWDGPAFTVTIPYDSSSTIIISIWQSPEIKLPSTFSFPHENRNVGDAFYVSASGEFEQLTGQVSFGLIREGRPVKGKFRFSKENGAQLQGKINAGWGNELVYCG